MDKEKDQQAQDGQKPELVLAARARLDAPGAAVAIQTLIHRAKRSSLRAKEPSTWRKTSLELGPIPDEHHESIFGYTDREPTRDERRRRNKEPLTLKQKAVFRAIRKHTAEHRVPPRSV